MFDVLDQVDLLLNIMQCGCKGAKGWSLQWESWSFLPMVASESDQGVGAPFQSKTVNEIRGLEIPCSGH